MGAPSFKVLYKKYAVVIIVPTLLFSAIISDLLHTRKWKASLAGQNQQQLA